MKILNQTELRFDAKSANESFARVAVSAFVAQLDPTLEELSDIKTVVSEAVTNSIVHGYRGEGGTVFVKVKILENRTIEIIVRDKGEGMADINLCLTPLSTSRPEMERSGMGFTIMETFMDRLTVTSRPGVGTTVRMRKKLRHG